MAADFTLNQRWAATLIGALVQGGVRRVVIAPGSRSTPLALAVVDRPELEHFVVIDERSAAFFALGLAKGSEAPTAVLCTSGTAGAHFLPAVMEANEGSTPLVVLTADRPWELQGFGAPQTTDQVGLFGKHVRVAEALAVPDEAGLAHLAAVTSRAVAIARQQRGPVHLNVPFREPLAPLNGVAGPVIDPPAIRFADDERVVRQAEISELIAKAERGVIVCGPHDDRGDFGVHVHELARRLGFVVIAEAASNARFGFPDAISTADALLRNERFAKDARPDLVLRFGGGITAKRPQQWLDECGAPIIEVSDTGKQFDPQHRVTWSVRALPEVASPATALLDKRQLYRAKWLEAHKAIRARLKTELSGRLDEPSVAQALVGVMPDGASLFLSSSMPIRDVDAFAASDRRLRVFTNRGVNGIDGVTSTALGVAASTKQPTALLIGDVALLHDLSAWLVARKHSLSLTVVCVNNDGGGIFHFLPIAERTRHFDELFGTPHGVELKTIADLSGATFHRPASLADFSATASNCLRGGLHLIEVKTDRRENVDVHRSLFARLAEVVP
ncbi:MAG: 2-succinyl-5-enolpyruvyl-6-hydroxy-3-cyclohexene-1-carboxylic-acid synthase [Myxococcaceae bacterium]